MANHRPSVFYWLGLAILAVAIVTIAWIAFRNPERLGF